MNVEIDTEATQFPFWEYFFQFSVRYLGIFAVCKKCVAYL